MLWPEMGYEDVGGYEAGFMVIKALAEVFPEFYRDHVAERIITPKLLWACAEALISLANEIAPIDMGGELGHTRQPVARLDNDNEGGAADSDYLEFLSLSRYYLMGPQPQMYGIGLGTYLNDYECEEMDPPSALTLLLWWMFRHTSVAVGINLEEGDFAERIQELGINRRKPLAGDVPAPAVWKHFALPGRTAPVETWPELLGYPFASTSTDLANVSWLEMDQNGDDWGYRWSKHTLLWIADEAKKATAIVAAYTSWEKEVDADPKRSCAVIARALHTAYRAARDAEPARLIDTLSGDEPVADLRNLV